MIIINSILYVFCVFVAVWQGIIFVGNFLNGSLENIGNLNILLSNGLW